MKKLLDELNLIDTKIINNKYLKKTLFKLFEDISYEMFVDKIKENSKSQNSYDRIVLEKNDNFELIVIRWNYECLPHNHNQSYGAVKILKGVMNHKIYKFQSTLKDAIELDKIEKCHSSALVFETPELIHSFDPCEAECISLHVYFKPINGMQVFNFKNQKTFTTKYDDGAWENEKILTIKLSNYVKKQFLKTIQNVNANPYFCDKEIAYDLASSFLDSLIDDYRIFKNNNSKKLLDAIENANYYKNIKPIYIKNGIEEPRNSLIPPCANRGYDYGINSHDRMKEFFYSEWWNWVLGILLNHDNVAHPSEHKGNRFHAISPIPKRDKELKNVSSSSGGGEFPVHNDATAYNGFSNKEEFLKRLRELNSNIEIMSQELAINQKDIYEQVLCKKYVRTDALLLVCVVNNYTNSFLAFPDELEQHLESLNFSTEDIICLSKMPVAHFAGPADGVVSNFVANVEPPIKLDKNNHIISTFINASINRMKYVGNSKDEKYLFERFYQALQNIPKHKILLKSGEALFIPNLTFDQHKNVMHGRDKIDKRDYAISIISDIKIENLRRFHIREYMMYRAKDNKKCFLEKNYKGTKWNSYHTK